LAIIAAPGVLSSCTLLLFLKPLLFSNLPMQRGNKISP